MSGNIDRRKFLKGAAAGGAVALTGCGATQSSMQWKKAAPVATPRRGANEEVRVAVVGIRGQGGSHIGNLLGAPNTKVVALCDVDENFWGPRAKMVTDAGQPKPQLEYDLRRLLDNKDIDAISIATPNHWHALAAIWACQAGKDVYVEKPCSHDIFEGRQILEAARKYKRIVQHGTQARSFGNVRHAMKLLHDGAIGEVYMARALCFKRRNSIGHKQDQAQAPKGVHYDTWLGPAPKKSFNENRFHYNWHWFWDYGNGDVGNQGVHQMDIARWGLNKTLPIRVSAMGGRYTYDDQAETPNTMSATMQYDDGKMLVFEVRGRQTNSEWGVGIGNLFYGSKGYLAISGTGGPFKTMINGKPGPKGSGGGTNHHENFVDAIRSRNINDLNAWIEEGHLSSAHCHLANVAYRLQRSLDFDPQKERFVNDAEANGMLSRDYREPFVVPKKV